MQLDQLATKQDLSTLELRIVNQIAAIQIELQKQINTQTWKFLGGLAALGAVFKYL